MAEEFINTDGLGLALTSIADKIGITVMQMYEIYVRAQFVMAITQIVLVVIWAIALVLIVKKFWMWMESENSSECVPLAIAGCMLSIVLLSFVFIVIYDATIALLCPEYTALQSLMHDIGDMIQLFK